MNTGIIKPSPYPDGTYKRQGPRIVRALTLDISNDEARAIRNGRRGCSCEPADLTRLGERCADIARECNAGSWSIYPLAWSMCGVPKVWVEFHNWPEMGGCNFKEPVGRKRYWWDVRPIPQWMAPDDKNAEKDRDGAFDMEA